MNFEVGEIHPNSPHLFADLAELLLLIGLNGRLRLHANDIESLITRDHISSDEIDDEDDSEKADKSSAEGNSRKDRQIEDIMSQLDYRSKSFGAYYPFSFQGGTLELGDQLSEEQRLYRFILACSRLRSFGRKGLPQRWAKGFAKLSKIAMTGLLPSHATTRIFDANSEDRHAYYGTDLRIALKKLGEELSVLLINENECEKAGPSGDAGYDIISSLNFEDGAATAYAVLGQCGAQETGWPNKTLEAHAINLKSYFQVQFDYPSVMFTPVCYRTATGEWVDNKCANGILLADRSRILSLIGKQNGVQPIVSTDWFANFETEFCQFGDDA